MMERKELYELIGLQEEVICQLQAIEEEVDLAQIDPLLSRLMDQKTMEKAYEELKAVLDEDEEQMRMLYCQLECVRRVWDRYRQKGISKIVYADTMKCFTRFLGECEQKNGRMFFDRGWWTYRQISMKIFRIGALEYEFCDGDEAGMTAVHIPSDADLSAASVQQSLAESRTFFTTFYPDRGHDKYICNSWLLSPVLRSLLPEGSRIAAFQDRFEITEVEKDSREYVEWLFQSPLETENENLPAQTSLQRKAKELMLAGGNIGSAYGILKEYGDIT